MSPAGRGTRRLVAAAAVALAIAAASAGCEPRPAPPPNIVVLVIDTLRPDRLGAYGHPGDTSPAIDALAAEGVVFEQAITVAPRTWQSFVSILTGLYPPRHGVRFIFDTPLVNEVPTLPGALAAAGYRTAAFDGMSFLRGMTAGHTFEEYFDPKAGKLLGDQRVVDMFNAWPGLDDTRPFFAFLRLGAPHWPYTCEPHFHDAGIAHPPALHAFNAGSQGLALKPGGLALSNSGAYEKLMYSPRTGAVLDHMRLHYDECVRTSDRAVGRVIERLRERGKLDNTLLVITSDHGESFGEHGYNAHGPQVDDPVMVVPLVMRFPQDRAPSRRGVRIDQLVRTIDIFPTIADVAGVPTPPQIDGRSLLPAIDGGKQLQLWAYGESGQSFVGVDPDCKLPGVAGKLRMVRTDRWKLVHVPDETGGTNRLYDIEATRGEDVDVAGEHPDVLASLTKKLHGLMSADTRAAGGLAPALSEDKKERLRQLGYL